MGIVRLEPHPVERIWGRRRLPAAFSALSDSVPVGEIWFEPEAAVDQPLLVKYLFTSERLSIQVHPDDCAARMRGHDRGKDEAWVILDAEPGAAIGIGLTREVSGEELRSAALDGSIEQLLDWRPVKAGDVYSSPAGTIHAIGAGLSLIEVQQNLDVTYRLYDYGRPRGLHLDDAITIATRAPHLHATQSIHGSVDRTVVSRGLSFVLERWRGELHGLLNPPPQRPVTLIPLWGDSRVDGEALDAGSVWTVGEPGGIEIDQGAALLVAYPGRDRLAEIIV